MLIYILDAGTKDRVAVIEEYESCIWTERFIDPGDFVLVLPEIGPNVRLLRGGTILENEESDIPMYIEGLELKDGALTCTGKSLEAFLNQRSVSAMDESEDESFNPAESASPGMVIAGFMYDIVGGYYGSPRLNTYISKTDLPQAGGDRVYEEVTRREKGHDLLARLCKKYNVDMYIKRIQQFYDYGPTSFFAFGTRNPVDRTAENTDDNSTVRFSPDDDSLIDMHEVYDATVDIDAIVVLVPIHFTAYGQIGYVLDPIVYGTVDGVDDFVDAFDIDELGPPFETRVREIDAEKLTLDYLKQQIYRYYGDAETIFFWDGLTFDEKQNVLIGEMKRMAKAEFNKAKKEQKHVIDGEASSTIFRYGIEYKLGDIVEITAGLNIRPSAHQKYPRVSGANTADRDTGLTLMQSIWNVARTRFPTDQVAMPRVIFVGPPNDGIVGTGYDAGSSSPSTLQVIWPDWVNAAFIGGSEVDISQHNTYNLLIHEWAHYFQRYSVFSDARVWVPEGGAQAFTRRVAPSIYADIGIPYINDPYGVDQYTSIDDTTDSGNAHGAVGRVEDEFSEEWILSGQFRLGTDAPVDAGNQKIVSEFIRSLDATGYRAYPTLSPPPVPAVYDTDPAGEQYPQSTTDDHTFSITGLLPSDLGKLSPHKIYVKSGQTRQLVKISQTGPEAGTCTLAFLLNDNEITSSDLPITLATGDKITIDASDHSSDATTVSGHFAIRVT